MQILLTNSHIKKIGKKYYLFHNNQIIFSHVNREIVLTSSLDKDKIKKLNQHCRSYLCLEN